MPELPEVEGVVRALAPVAKGRTIQGVTVSDTVIQFKTIRKRSDIQRNYNGGFYDGYGRHDNYRCYTP